MEPGSVGGIHHIILKDMSDGVLHKWIVWFSSIGLWVCQKGGTTAI